jgi:hypothetical protein
MPSFLKKDFKTIKVPIDVNKYRFSFRMNDIPTIIHAPSNPILKGTPLVRYGLKQLQKAGYKFKYVELSGKANSLVLSELQKSHIVIDKICGAGIGLFPLEAMACGNVVLGVANIDYHTSRGEDCPVIQINPMNFIEKVKWTLDHPEEWEALAVRGRKYVEKYHDKDVVEMQLKNDIEDVMNK